MIRALGIFTLAYVLISKPRWPKLELDRTSAALVAAVLMVGTGVLSAAQAYAAVDWNTLILLLAMFVLAGVFASPGSSSGRRHSCWHARARRRPF